MSDNETSAYRKTMTIVFEKPEVKPRIFAYILKLLMLIGVAGIIASALSALFYLGCEGLSFLLRKGVFADYFDAEKIAQYQKIALDFLYFAMLASILYGFASFIWYKITAYRIFGRVGAFILFLLIPIGLIILKWYSETLALPKWINFAARYYSLMWYALIFFLGTLLPVREKTKIPVNPFARFTILLFLCYLPYAYVLLVGEQIFIADVFRGHFSYFLDAQLIVFALLPLR